MDPWSPRAKMWAERCNVSPPERHGMRPAHCMALTERCGGGPAPIRYVLELSQFGLQADADLGRSRRTCPLTPIS